MSTLGIKVIGLMFKEMVFTEDCLSLESAERLIDAPIATNDEKIVPSR